MTTTLLNCYSCFWEQYSRTRLLQSQCKHTQTCSLTAHIELFVNGSLEKKSALIHTWIYKSNVFKRNTSQRPFNTECFYVLLSVKVAEYCVAFPIETFMMKIECKSD